jgi:hypothetical protein
MILCSEEKDAHTGISAIFAWSACITGKNRALLEGKLSSAQYKGTMPKVNRKCWFFSDLVILVENGPACGPKSSSKTGPPFTPPLRWAVGRAARMGFDQAREVVGLLG